MASPWNHVALCQLYRHTFVHYSARRAVSVENLSTAAQLYRNESLAVGVLQSIDTQ